MNGRKTAVIEAAGLRKEFTVRRKVSRLRSVRRTVVAVDGIKMLTGVLAPTAGTVRVCGLIPVPQRRRLARQIGVVFGQRSQLWWDLPLRDSFELARHIWQVPAANHAARLAELRRELDLDPVMDVPVRQLSLGQRMRAELTISLLHQPRVLFLDEPTIGLDAISKQAVRSFLVKLRDAGDTTIVLTTHDLADIERLCPRLVVIDHGRVVHDGTLAALHERYGSCRRVIAELDEPLTRFDDLPGVVVEESAADGQLVTFGVNGTGATVADLVTRLAASGKLRDVSVREPTIEDVIARLYAGSAPPSPVRPDRRG